LAPLEPFGENFENMAIVDKLALTGLTKAMAFGKNKTI